jgi:hypothetical protein
MWKWPTLVGGVALITAACTLGSADTTTTTAAAPTTTQAPSTTTTTTTTTLAPFSDPTFPAYSIVERIEDAQYGDTVVVLLDPTSYTVLTEIDLYDVIADVVDRFPPIFEAHIVDSAVAATLVFVEDPTDEQLQILAEHYFASLHEGFRIVYQGKYAELGTTVLGS